MNEKQYKEVCQACDHLLTMPGVSLERISIPWLHVIREHPSFLKDYEQLFISSGFRDVIKVLVKKTYFLAGWLRNILRAGRPLKASWRASHVLSGETDVLLVSHLLNDADAGKVADFYFGNLPELLRLRGYRVVVALINHSGRPDAAVVQKWRGDVSPRVLLSNTLDLRNELSLYLRLRRESQSLKAAASRAAPGVIKKVFSFASIEAMTGHARDTLRLSVQLGELVALIKPKIMIVTYEGHAWERAVFAAARRQSANLQCVGYLHAAVFRLQHGASRMLGQTFDPDLVLAAGPVSKTQIGPSLAAKGIPVRVLGSSRASANKQENTARTLPCGQSPGEWVETSRNTCLVLPEGIISECLLLFNFSLDCAELMPEVKFIWRLHPLVSFESLERKNPRFRLLPKNVEFSQAALEDDCRRSRYALYRGSTTVVKAVSCGLQPVYLSQAGEMTVDPLYELDHVRAKVSSPEKFLGLIREKKVSPNADLHNQKVVEGYCENFYTPLDPEVISSMLA